MKCVAISLSYHPFTASAHFENAVVIATYEEAQATNIEDDMIEICNNQNYPCPTADIHSRGYANLSATGTRELL